MDAVFANNKLAIVSKNIRLRGDNSDNSPILPMILLAFLFLAFEKGDSPKKNRHEKRAPVRRPF